MLFARTPQHMLPFSRKATPPNILFSEYEDDREQGDAYSKQDGQITPLPGITNLPQLLGARAVGDP